eukprot:jgi/Galph1/5702/GphlegSOOS_G4354.1
MTFSTNVMLDYILLYGSFTQHDFSKCYCDIVRDLKNGNGDHQRIQQSIRVLFDAGKSISTNRKMLGIKQRIQAKKGTIRKSLLGKRVDFCGRTVLRPNPEISLEEIEIPSVMSKAFTKKPEKITNENWEEYLKAWSEVPTPDLHAKRSLQNGDYVLMNRQPTLHKQGIMAHKVVLGDTKTIGLHLSVTTPYNADFDGDEGNLHFPQLSNPKFIEKMASLKKEDNINKVILEDGTTQLVGKLLLRQTYQVVSCWRKKDPIEVGSGTTIYSQGYFDRLIDKESYKEQVSKIYHKDGVYIRDTEHLWYYQVFRNALKAKKFQAPPHRSDTLCTDPCPYCGYQLDLGTFCRTCGAYDRNLRQRRE